MRQSTRRLEPAPLRVRAAFRVPLRRSAVALRSQRASVSTMAWRDAAAGVSRVAVRRRRDSRFAIAARYPRCLSGGPLSVVP